MEYSLDQLADKVDCRLAVIKHFCEDFNIDIYAYKTSMLHLWWVRSDTTFTNEFCDYILKNKNFIYAYGEDYYDSKSLKVIAEKINRSESDVLNCILKINKGEIDLPSNSLRGTKLPIYQTNPYSDLKYVSSYVIDWALGGDYSFLDFNAKKTEEISENKIVNIPITNIIGYDDVFMSIIEQIEPITDPGGCMEWGLNYPGGILLFGPPGCGKTFWASNIAKIIDYSFEEIPRSTFGSSYVDGAMLNLKKLIEELKTKTRLVIFFDEFDSIASSRGLLSSNSREEAKVVNTLLQEIPKLIEKNILIIAATNYMESLDPAVMRPGRFDLKIPVFPPNKEERMQLIVHYLTQNLPNDSKLWSILKYNGAIEANFWHEASSQMTLFSVSLVFGFTQLLKRRLKLKFSEYGKVNSIMDSGFISEIVSNVKTNITAKDVELFAQFFNEVSSLNNHFYQERLDFLYGELEVYFPNKKKAPSPIGFRKPDVD